MIYLDFIRFIIAINALPSEELEKELADLIPLKCSLLILHS